MPVRHKYVPGEWLFVCDICSRAFYASKAKRGVSTVERGRSLCPDCWSPRNPRETNTQVVRPESHPTWPKTRDRRPSPLTTGLPGGNDDEEY